MIDVVKLIVGLLLPWVIGVTLVRVVWRRADFVDGPAYAATILGYGYFAGIVALTLWMRGIAAIGLHFRWLTIALPLFVLAGVLLYWIRPRPRWVRMRSDGAAFMNPGLVGWRRIAWFALLALIACHLALVAFEVAWRPLFAWDAWMQWATKARVWFEQRTIVPFVGADRWMPGTPGLWYDPAPNYPSTIPLLQAWTAHAYGQWNDVIINWPWWVMLVAAALAFHGQARQLGATSLLALTGAYFLVSLPFVDTHVALAGYADLPMGIVYLLAVMAFTQWLIHGDRASAIVALAFALACPLIKTPGIVWALTLVPGLVAAFFPRYGLRLVGILFALAGLALLVLSQYEPVVLGYRLHTEFHPVWQPIIDNYFLLGNWHLLFGMVLAIAIFSGRELIGARLFPLTAIVACGIAFLFVVFFFTNAQAWVTDVTTLNRATLHLAPTLLFFGLVLWLTIPRFSTSRDRSMSILAADPFATRKLRPGYAKLRGKLGGGTESTQIVPKTETRDR